MIEKIQHKYALSRNGAIDLVKACFSVTVTNFALISPIVLLYFLIKDLFDNTLDPDKIWIYTVGCVIVLAIIAITNYIQYNATFLSTYKESGVRRTSLAETLRKLPLSFFGKKDLADLTTTIMSDCARMETASSHWIPELIGAILSTAIIGVGLFFFNWKMALSCFWVIPVSFLIVILSSGAEKKAVSQLSGAKLEMSDGIQECLESVRDLRACNAQRSYLAYLIAKIKKVEKQSLATEIRLAVFINSAAILLKFGIATTALVGGSLLSKGEIDLLTFLSFLICVSRLYDPMQITLQNLAAVIASHVQSERLDEILSHEIQGGDCEMSNNGYDISFDHVKFSYSGEKDVLKDVSFTAKQGQVTALIGPSGGGKTTVTRLAARFWDVDEGKILLGGMDISKVDPETLFAAYSIVFQDVTLFNNTVMENIRIGKRDASDEEVLRAARLANCDNFVKKLPDGYNTMIGENGSELSGGERQRLSIARAILKDAPVILLDEATASLDAENESLIQQALSTLIKDKTVLIIAHRMRTIADVDHIVVLKDGIVAEEGTPAQLQNKNGIYSHMCKQQNIAYDWRI
ncbi:MAG: ABC transporter ATP-binding protein [Butyrivibrio sp.]|nr:ABC transporter ATP-binding protein [Butyrivibrio sp.]